MASESGFSNQKKYGLSQYKTIHSVGSSKFGEFAAQMYLYDLNSTGIPLDSVTVDENDPKKMYLGIPSHTSRVGDIVRILNLAPLSGWEFEIIQIVDADIVAVYNLGEINGVPTIPQVGDEVKVCRWITAKADAEGSLTTSSGPTQFIRNGLTATVTQDDATPANNRPLPSGMYILKDGVMQPVTKDTVTPANTISIPVELNSASGPINITAGDLNVQLSDMGANYDRTRIGDGTGNQWGFNASSEGLVHDQDVLDKLIDIEAMDFATETTLDAVKTSVETIDNAIATDGGAVPSQFMAVGGHTGTTAHAWYVDSSGVGRVDVRDTVLAPDASTATLQTANNTLVGAVNETAPATDTDPSGLNGRLQRLAQRITSLISLLPTSLGQNTMANSLAVTLASDQSSIPVSSTSSDLTANGNITAINDTVTITSLNGQNSLAIQTIGTYTGSLTVQGSINGSVWTSLTGIVNLNSGTTASSIASGSQSIFQVDCSAFSGIRVIALGAVTGSVNVVLRASTATSNVPIDTPLPFGTNIIGSLSSNQSVNLTQILGSGVQVGTGASGSGVLRVVLANNSPGVAARVPSYQEILNLTTSAQTFTAPVGSRWCKVYADDTNTATIRLKIGGTATTSSGIQFQPGRSEDFEAVGDISVIAESGTNQKINVTFGV